MSGQERISRQAGGYVGAPGKNNGPHQNAEAETFCNENSLLFMDKFWRRRELNPRPEEPKTASTTCVVGGFEKLASPRSRRRDHGASYPLVGLLAAASRGTKLRPAYSRRPIRLVGVNGRTGHYLSSQCHGGHDRPNRHNRSNPIYHIFGTYLFARFFTRPPDNLGTRSRS